MNQLRASKNTPDSVGGVSYGFLELHFACTGNDRFQYMQEVGLSLLNARLVGNPCHLLIASVFSN
jgi:hypothetical protein